MGAVLKLPNPLDRAATFRALARDRLRLADEAKNRGDWARYTELREDVLAFDEQADIARGRAEAMAVQRAHFARAIAAVLHPLRASVRKERA